MNNDAVFFFWTFQSGTFTEQEFGEINFREISTPILEKVIQYFHYKLKYTNSTTEIPEFPIEPEIALELVCWRQVVLLAFFADIYDSAYGC